jgi:hypothetical protein
MKRGIMMLHMSTVYRLQKDADKHCPKLPNTYRLVCSIPWLIREHEKKMLAGAN